MDDAQTNIKTIVLFGKTIKVPIQNPSELNPPCAEIPEREKDAKQIQFPIAINSLERAIAKQCQAVEFPDSDSDSFTDEDSQINVVYKRNSNKIIRVDDEEMEDSLNSTANPWDERFQRKLNQLKEHKEKYGDLIFRVTENSLEKALSVWCSHVRNARRTGRSPFVKLSPSKIAALDALGFNWNRQKRRKISHSAITAHESSERKKMKTLSLQTEKEPQTPISPKETESQEQSLQDPMWPNIAMNTEAFDIGISLLREYIDHDKVTERQLRKLTELLKQATMNRRKAEGML